MAATAKQVTQLARQAGQRLASRDTPFLRDCWYVAGFAGDFGPAMKARTLLGKPLLFYRGSDGRPVAMDDRCLHRSYPLSKGTLENDEVVCGYHGLRYDRSGQCVAIPGQKGQPRGIGVRAYPLREQGPLVWIWLGDDAPQGDPPLGDWAADGQAWPYSNSYFHLKANYISLHENLLDLTHLSFLHAATFGTPDYAFAPYEVEVGDDGRFAVLRHVSPTRLPPVWGKPTGLEGKDAARTARSQFLSPAAHTVNVRFWECALAEADRPDTQITTAHLMTPETATTTHYFIHHGRNFAVEDDGVTRFMHDQLMAAFQEDVDALEALERMVAQTPADDFFEISIAADRAGLAMRRWLLQKVECETA